MPSPLLLSRRFAPLFWCQFFAAFNDNFLKTALVFVILFQSDTADSEALITLASAVFIAPFFFLSALGGQLADRYDKAKVAQRLKFAETFIAAFAVLGYARSSLPILFVALFAFGVLAALFGPIKYGILPDHLRREQLPSGNALIEGATFVAILLGTIAAGLASRGSEAGTFAALVISFAFACWISALLIPATGEGAPHLKIETNIAASTVATMRHLHSDSRLWWGAGRAGFGCRHCGAVAAAPLIKTLIMETRRPSPPISPCSRSVGVGSGPAALHVDASFRTTPVPFCWARLT
jgi:acyl-[acyl-carrier-protein]-phospholipid O-acyltransferase/long-chain-fatty-acid--[acyl-carrier-protein] ligase